MDLTPEEWLERLTGRLSADLPAIEKHDGYYRGDHETPDIPAGARAEFSRFLTMSRANFVRLVVDAIDERLRVDGFSTGNDDVDNAIWAIWKANGLTSRQSGAHVDALVRSRSYGMVWPRPGSRIPRITLEDSTQVIHESDAEDTDVVLAVLKVWTDDLAKVQRANVIIRGDGIHKYQREPSSFGLTDGWKPLEGDDRYVPLPSELEGRVPVEPLLNRADVNAFGQSEIADVIPTQDRINKTLFDRIVAAEYGAFRQRWATGLELPTDPQTNQPIDTFEASVRRFAVNPEPDGKFGTFDATDLRPYLDVIEQDLVLMARIAGVPPHYLTSKGEFPSGDALRSAEAPLIARCVRKQDTFGDGWERLMGMAARLAGMDDVMLETQWRNPETRTYGEAADWALKLSQVPGITSDLLLPRLGFTRDEIANARRRANTDRLLSAVEPLSEAEAS